jgi:hypothetical protein
MPVYVLRYGNKDGPLTVDYGDGPASWKIANRYAADMHCKTLRSFGVHVGEHYCNFAVHELESCEFAIVAPHTPHKSIAALFQGYSGKI